MLHFASPASPIDYLRLPLQTLKVGAYGTHNMLGLAKAHRARFLTASTSEVYGDPHVHPQPETYWGNVNPIGPRGVYDEAKRYAEALTMAYHRQQGVDTAIVRIFNTYGPRMRAHDGRAIPTFVRQALSGRADHGVRRRLARRARSATSTTSSPASCALAESDEHLPVNIGNPEEFTLLELAEKVISLTASESRIVFEALPANDPKQRRPDITRAGELLGWAPRIGLDDGLRMLLERSRRARAAGPDGGRMKRLLTALLAGLALVGRRRHRRLRRAGAHPLRADAAGPDGRRPARHRARHRLPRRREPPSAGDPLRPLVGAHGSAQAGRGDEPRRPGLRLGDGRPGRAARRRAGHPGAS